MHKQSGKEALTKAQLKDLLAEREDLVRRVASFGADIPTTPMYWKRHGNELEWIVRQMSWKPRWCPVSEKKSTPHVANVFQKSMLLKTEMTEENPQSIVQEHEQPRTSCRT